MRKLHIAICGVHSYNGYSGGRYFSWLLAETLANLGHRLTFWTNNEPPFIDDFISMPAHESISILIDPGFNTPPKDRLDIVILVPHIDSRNDDIYAKAIWLTSINQARLILINFESPNWFNSLSPVPREPILWDTWFDASRFADMILSTSQEGMSYAKDYYTKAHPDTIFRFCHPAINSIVADSVVEQERKSQILCITRFTSGGDHKGGAELLQVIDSRISGYTLTILIGTGSAKGEVENAIRQKADRFQVRLRFIRQANDFQKFTEIKASALMLFLSFFEGYGYPPVEAAYCGTPCISYDLPVVREVCRDSLIYVPVGDTDKLKEAVNEVLSNNRSRPNGPSDHIVSIARFDQYAKRLGILLDELMEGPAPVAVKSRISVSELWKWYWQLDKEAAGSRQHLNRKLDNLQETKMQLINDNRNLLNRLKRNDEEMRELTKDSILGPLIKTRFALKRAIKRLVLRKHGTTS